MPLFSLQNVFKTRVQNGSKINTWPSKGLSMMAIVLWLLLQLRAIDLAGGGPQPPAFPWETIRMVFFPLTWLQASLNGDLSQRGQVHGLPGFQQQTKLAAHA